MLFITPYGAFYRKNIKLKGFQTYLFPGAPCEEAYSKMLDACQRLNERLGAYDEDEDAERIINSMMTICHEVGIHMFECGKRMA